MNDLFEEANENRREQLRQLGWFPVWGGNHWRRPDGLILTEAEAFDQLDREKQDD